MVFERLKQKKREKREKEMEEFIDEFLLFKRLNMTFNKKDFLKKVRWKSRKWLKYCIIYGMLKVLDEVIKSNERIEYFYFFRKRWGEQEHRQHLSREEEVKQ